MSERSGSLEDLVDELVLQPLGPLHREPDRILLEEIPSTAEVVVESVEGHVLVGEVEWSDRVWSATAVKSGAQRLAQRALPDLPRRLAGAEVIRCLFVPEVAKGVRRRQGEVTTVTAAELLGP